MLSEILLYPSPQQKSKMAGSILRRMFSHQNVEDMATQYSATDMYSAKPDAQPGPAVVSRSPKEQEITARSVRTGSRSSTKPTQIKQHFYGARAVIGGPPTTLFAKYQMFPNPSNDVSMILNMTTLRLYHILRVRLLLLRTPTAERPCRHNSEEEHSPRIV